MLRHFCGRCIDECIKWFVCIVAAMFLHVTGRDGVWGQFQLGKKSTRSHIWSSVRAESAFSVSLENTCDIFLVNSFLMGDWKLSEKKSVIYGWSTALILNFRSLNSIIHTSFSPNIMLLGAVIWHVTQRGGEKWVCQEADGMRKFSTMKRKERTFQCTCDIKSKEWGLYILEL